MLNTYKNLIVFVVLVLLAMACVSLGYMKGVSTTEKEYAQEKLNQAKATAKLIKEIHEKEKSHVAVTVYLQNKLEQEKLTYEESISSIRSASAAKLLSSETRATRYKRMSEAGTLQCGQLADITTKYDSALTRGTDLVRLLTTTAGYQQQSIGTLIKQLESDRILLNLNSR